MQRTLSQHIGELEAKIVTLKRLLRDPQLADYQKSEYALALGNAEEALKLFRRALELEQNLPPQSAA